jgi:hypothetical protein
VSSFLGQQSYVFNTYLPAALANANSAKRAVHALPDHPPIISHGPPGRSAVTGHVATVFGCTSFLGRYLISKLSANIRSHTTLLRDNDNSPLSLTHMYLRRGMQVIIPYRDEDDKCHLKVTSEPQSDRFNGMFSVSAFIYIYLNKSHPLTTMFAW